MAKRKRINYEEIILAVEENIFPIKQEYYASDEIPQGIKKEEKYKLILINKPSKGGKATIVKIGTYQECLKESEKYKRTNQVKIIRI